MEGKELFLLFAYHSHSWHCLLLPLLLKHPVKRGKEVWCTSHVTLAGIGEPTEAVMTWWFEFCFSVFFSDYLNRCNDRPVSISEPL